MMIRSFRIHQQKILLVIIVVQLVIGAVWFFKSQRRFPTIDDLPETTNEGDYTFVHLPNYIKHAVQIVNRSNTTKSISRAQHHVFIEYTSNHAVVMDKLIHYNGDVVDTELKNAQFVIFRPYVNAGFGNIAMGLVSTFFYALLSNRIFLIDWKPGGYRGCQASLHDLLREPQYEEFKLEWDFHKLPLNAKRFLKSRYHMEETVNHEISGIADRYFKCSPSYTSIYGGSHFNADQINNKRVIELDAAQYFAPLLFGDNPYYARFMQKIFPFSPKTGPNEEIYKVNVFGPIGKWLLKLSPQLQKDYDVEYKKVFEKKLLTPGKTFVLGIQIRKNLREAMFYLTPTQLFWECARDQIMQLQGTKYEHLVIFVTTDYELAVTEGQQWFAKEKDSFSFLKSVEFKRVTRPKTINPHSRDLEAVRHALVEMWLLAAVDDMITSEKSTFGHVAHGVRSLVPLVVRRENRNPPQCIRAHSTEPWFHLRKRSNNEKCL